MSEQPKLEVDKLREVALKLDVIQFTKREVQLSKEDLRETLKNEHEKHVDALAKRDWKNVKIAISVGALIIGGDIAAWFQAYNYLKQQMVTSMDRHIEDLNHRYAATVDRQVAALNKDISKRLDQEFQTPRIRSLVEDSAKSYTERQAKSYIEKRIDDGLKPYQEKTSQAASEIEGLRSILFLADEAADGSRSAYDKLKYEMHKKSRYSDLAHRKISVINDDLAYYNQAFGIVLALELSMEIDGKQTRISKLPIRQLFLFLADKRASRETRFSVLKDIVEAKPDNEVATEALLVLKEFEYLPAIAATCAILRHKFKQSIEFMDIDSWINFLEKMNQSPRRPG